MLMFLKIAIPELQIPADDKTVAEAREALEVQEAQPEPAASTSETTTTNGENNNNAPTSDEVKRS